MIGGVYKWNKKTYKEILLKHNIEPTPEKLESRLCLLEAEIKMCNFEYKELKNKYLELLKELKKWKK